MRYEELFEMAFTRKDAEIHIRGLAFPLNLHLLKIRAFENFSDKLRGHWRKEVENFLDDLRSLRLKPNNKIPLAKFYFKLLYAERFEGVEVQNTLAFMQRIRREYRDEGPRATTPTMMPEAGAAWLLQFHTTLSEKLHRAENVFDMIP